MNDFYLEAIRRTHLREPRMHPGRQTVMVGEAAEEQEELLSLTCAQGGAKGVVVCLCHIGDLAHDVRSLVRESERVEAPVLGVVAPLEQTTLLELVEEGDQAARQHSQQGRQRLLTDPSACCNSAQDSRVRRRKAGRRQPLGKLGCGKSADLRHKESGGTRMLTAGGSMTVCSHAKTIA
jgi:hypothetical protein